MSDFAQHLPINSVAAAPIDEEGNIIETRVKTPDEARGMYKSLWDADAGNRQMRAMCQAMLDGRPPMNPAKLKQANLEGICNINWRYATLAMRQAEGPYNDMLASVPYFLSIRTDYGDIQEKIEWERIMSEEFGRMLRSWQPFEFRFQRLVNYFLAHGTAIAYFPDAHDWRFKIATAGQFVVPRLADADTTDFNELGTRGDFQPSDLYRYIKDCPPEQRKGWFNGWHVPTVMKALQAAAPKDFYRANDWELNEQIWKANEVYWSLSNIVVPYNLLWIQEIDGSVTQVIVSEKTLAANGDKFTEDFLYKEENFFPRMDRGVVTFAYGVGTNGEFHSIRGYLNEIFPIINELNILKCKAVDAMKVQLAFPLKADQDVLNDGLPYEFAGPALLIFEGVEMLDRQSPNYANSVFPGMDMLHRDLNDQKGGFSIDLGQSRTERTKYELQLASEQSTGLGTARANLFYSPWERLLKEICRRTMAVDTAIEPGGREVFDFRKRCIKRGVPSEALKEIDIERCTVVRSIGDGSASARLVALDRMKEVVPMFDEQGRQNWGTDFIASIPGMTYEMATRYIPPVQNMRPSEEVKRADMESQLMEMGRALPVYPNDDHLIHARQHLVPMMAMVEQVEMGQMEMTAAVQPLSLLYQHTFEHLQLLGNDPIMQQEINQYRKDMQQVAEIVVNGSRKIQAEQERAAKEGQEYGGPEGLSEADIVDVERKKQLLYREMKDSEFADAMNQVKLMDAQQKLARGQQDMANQQRQVDSKLVREDVLTANKLVTENRKLRQRPKA